MRLFIVIITLVLLTKSGIAANFYGNTGTIAWSYDSNSCASGMPYAYFYLHFTYTHNLNLVGTQYVYFTPVGTHAGNCLTLSAYTANSFTVKTASICNCGLQPSGTNSAAQNSC